MITNSTEEGHWSIEKCRILLFGGSNLRNDASDMLDQYRTGSHI